MIGTTVQHYRILEKVGGGGMGVVYKAEDLKLKRLVALKFLPPELTRDEEAKKRFIHEAQAVCALQHNAICTVHDIDETSDGKLFMVMDLYEGETLKQKIERGPIELDDAVNIAVQIAQGLALAHEKGIVHRDVKPANVLVTKEGNVKIVDFGLAKLLGSQQITKEGKTVGTTMYMSPEQLKGETIDARTDIWSFGVLFYQMLTGKFPFPAEFAEAVMYQINCQEPPPISSVRPQIPEDICRIVARCLEKEKSRRPASMDEILRDLGQAPRHSRFALQAFLSHKYTVISLVALASVALVLYLVGNPGFEAGKRDLRLAVLVFVNETKDRATDAYGPEIQRVFIKELLGGGKIFVDDRLRFNAAIKQEFATEIPSRTDDLFKFLRKNQYDYVVDGSITNSPQGGHAIQANLRMAGEFQSVEEFHGLIRNDLQLDSEVGALSKQILAYLRTKVLDIKPELGVWNRKRPNNWAAVAKLEDAYKFYCADDRRAANTALREAVQIDSTFISPRIWLASYYKRYDPEEGRKNLRYLQSLKSSVDDFGRAMIDWMGAFFEDNYGGQILHLQRALSFDPRNRVLLENLAATYEEMHDTLNVLAAYKYCIETRWEYQPFYRTAVRYYLGQRNYAAAREALLIWRELDTVSVSPLICGWLSAIARRTGDTVEAEKWKSRFVILCADSAISRTAFTLGSCYVDAGLVQEGDALVRSAIALEPSNAEFRQRLAVSLLARGDSVAGLRELKVAAQLNPRGKALLLILGNVLREKGDASGALEQYQRYLLRDSTGYDAQQIRKWASTLHR